MTHRSALTNTLFLGIFVTTLFVIAPGAALIVEAVERVTQAVGAR